MSLDVHSTSLAGQVLAPTGSNVVLAEWTADAATGPEPLYQAPLHKHEDDEAWYVLSGVLRIKAGGEEIEVPAGGAVVVPGGTPHTYWNPGSEPARYLLVMGVRTYGLIQAIHAPDRGDLRELFAKYGAELLE